MEGGADFVGGRAVVETRFGHLERVSGLAGDFVWAVAPLDHRSRVAVGFADELLRVTSEHWDGLRELCVVNDGFICRDTETTREFSMLK